MNERNYEAEILDYLYEYGEKCGANCGKLAVDFSLDLKMDFEDVKQSLNELYKAKQIIWRDGAQGKLFFINYRHYEPRQTKSD